MLIQGRAPMGTLCAATAPPRSHALSNPTTSLVRHTDGSAAPHLAATPALKASSRGSMEGSTAVAQVLAHAAGRRRIVHAGPSPSRVAHPSRHNRHEASTQLPAPSTHQSPGFSSRPRPAPTCCPRDGFESAGHRARTSSAEDARRLSPGHRLPTGQAGEGTSVTQPRR